MDVVCLHHVSLPVTNLERSKSFYMTLFQWDELPHPPFRKPGAWLSISPGSELHINEEPSAEFRRSRGINTLERHFAVTVSCFKRAVERLREFGFSETASDGDPKRLVVTKSAAGYDRAYFLDPDFNIIEVNSQVTTQ